MKILIIIENLQPNEQQIRMLKELKDEINAGQNLVEFVEASTGSLVLQVGVHETAISFETILAEVLLSFIQRLLKFLSVEINDLEVLNMVLISEDDCSDIGLVIDTDGLESCFDSNRSPDALQLELNVDTDLFDSEQRLSSEIAGLVGRVIKSNGNDSLSNVTAILTSDVYDDSRKFKLIEKVDDGISEFSFGYNSQFESTFLELDQTPKMSKFDVNKQDIVINIT